MGYKVINKNVIINQKNNTVMDNIFFFQTIEQAEEYVLAQKNFYGFSGKNTEPFKAVIEECTAEENERYVFSQYNEKYNPNDMKVPNVIIERPIEIAKGVPYWVTRRELLISE